RTGRGRAARFRPPPRSLARQLRRARTGRDPGRSARREQPAPASDRTRAPARAPARRSAIPGDGTRIQPPRSEEHTSELQSRENLVCRLLLEKKKKINSTHTRL